jgi:hydroxycarboxylate dehydrogenase B
LLGGALANAMTLRNYPTERRILNGMLTILIDPQKLSPGDRFGQESIAFIDWVRASPAMAGTDGVKIAGEPERQARADRQVNGIPIDSNTWRDILLAAEKLGRDPLLIQRLAQAGQ